MDGMLSMVMPPCRGRVLCEIAGGREGRRGGRRLCDLDARRARPEADLVRRVILRHPSGESPLWPAQAGAISSARQGPTSLLERLGGVLQPAKQQPLGGSVELAPLPRDQPDLVDRSPGLAPSLPRFPHLTQVPRESNCQGRMKRKISDTLLSATSRPPCEPLD